MAQPKINLQSFKSTPDSLKQRFKAFGRKPSLGAPESTAQLQRCKIPNTDTEVSLFSLSILHFL